MVSGTRLIIAVCIAFLLHKKTIWNMENLVIVNNEYSFVACLTELILEETRKPWSETYLWCIQGSCEFLLKYQFSMGEIERERNHYFE